MKKDYISILCKECYKPIKRTSQKKPQIYEKITFQIHIQIKGLFIYKLGKDKDS